MTFSDYRMFTFCNHPNAALITLMQVHSVCVCARVHNVLLGMDTIAFTSEAFAPLCVLRTVPNALVACGYRRYLARLSH